MVNVIFWISATFILYTYLFYPLIIVLWSRLFPKPVCLNIESFEWPRVTMIIIAYNEEANILRKIENCRQLDYPKELLEICIVSDGSADGTNDILIAQPDIHVIIDDNNHGKPYQINRAVRETDSDAIVFADARQTFEKNALKMLVRNFSDPTIGSVSGELVFVSTEDHTERHIGLYWKYEKILRKAESAVDSTLGVTGAIYAIRRDLFAPIPDDTILDDVETPLRGFRKGYRVIFDSEAVAYDTAYTEISAEFRRKVRTLTGNYQLFDLNQWLLDPSKNRIFFQSMSHKLFRLFVPYFMVPVSAFLWFQAACYLASITAIMFKTLRRNSLLNFFSVFISLNAASVMALINFTARKADARWKQ
jgi:cellulose synthase/poly-beta-1,6-N-acetylglucosamine synthase-like glycosyltransferase